jgi:hypothetical protein
MSIDDLVIFSDSRRELVVPFVYLTLRYVGPIYFAQSDKTFLV